MAASAARITARWRRRSNQAAPSSAPGKRGEVAVVPLAEHAEGQTEALYFRLLRPGQRQPPIGGMGRVVDIERLARPIARRHALDLEAQHAGNVGDAPQPVGGEIDGLVFD